MEKDVESDPFSKVDLIRVRDAPQVSFFSFMQNWKIVDTPWSEK